MAPLLERIAEHLASGRPPYDMADFWGKKDSDSEAGSAGASKASNSHEQKPLPTASKEQVAAAEVELGFALPELLREIYMRVGNGGFGPAYGLIGIAGGLADADGVSLEQIYADFRRSMPGLPSPWPERLLPICNNGCGIYECLDCAHPDGLIYYYDPNIPGDGPWGEFLVPRFKSLEEWLDLWLRVEDPFERKSATIDFDAEFRDVEARREEHFRRRDLGPVGYWVEHFGVRETGSCECCGQASRVVWGVVAHERTYCAVYFVRWTAGHFPERGANFDLILGRWGEGTSAADRYAVSLEYRLNESGPAFMVVDANARDIAKNELAGRALRRDEVVGRPFSEHVFTVCDAILMKDERLDELYP